MLAAVAALDRSPWDDDLAYTPLVKRLLDTGGLVEPFSFRRMGAYGGQTALGALAAARGTLANPSLVDHGLCFGIALLIVLGMAREHRVPPIWTATLALVLLLLPDTSINTGAHWAGVVMFLALYRAATRDRWLLVGLLGAAACTLRQNYIVVVALFAIFVLARRLLATRRAAPWPQAVQLERARWLPLAAATALALAGWCVAAFLSNHTFLFPLQGGTWNRELSIQPTGTTWAQELLRIAWAAIETSPIVVVPVLFALLAVTQDERPGAPLRSLFAAVTLGFLALVHGFGAADPTHLWRYAFGSSAALTAIFVVEVSAGRERPARLAPLGRWLLLAALALQLLAVRGTVARRFAALADDLHEAAAVDLRGDPSALADAQRHAAMQAAIPAGGAVAVLLDDPAYLDFRRNPIANLDTPGFASPEAPSGAQMPAFRGAEALREYLVEAGYPYVAFVRSERSRYCHRRGFWLWRLFNDAEMFRIMSAYELDMIDSLAELAGTTRVLHDEDWLVVLYLAAPRGPAGRPGGGTGGHAGDRPGGPEPVRRDAWIRELAEREHLLDVWALTPRRDLIFADGIEDLELVDPRPALARWLGAHRAVRGRAVRALHRRAHLRVTGEAEMRFALRASLARSPSPSPSSSGPSPRRPGVRPRLDVAFDGALLASAVADEQGVYTVDLPIPAARLAGGWHDLYLVFSGAADPGGDDRELRVAALEELTWLPAR